MNREIRRAHARHACADTLAAHRDMDPAHASTIMLRLHSAVADLASGSTDGDLFDRVAAAVNVGMIRAERIGQPAVDVMLAARDALLECDAICGRHARFGFTGPGRLAVAAALDIYEQILRGSTPRQMRDAAFESARRMRAGQVVGATENIADCATIARDGG